MVRDTFIEEKRIKLGAEETVRITGICQSDEENKLYLVDPNNYAIKSINLKTFEVKTIYNADWAINFLCKVTIGPGKGSKWLIMKCEGGVDQRHRRILILLGQNSSQRLTKLQEIALEKACHIKSSIVTLPNQKILCSVMSFENLFEIPYFSGGSSLLDPKREKLYKLPSPFSYGMATFILGNTEYIILSLMKAEFVRIFALTPKGLKEAGFVSNLDSSSDFLKHPNDPIIFATKFDGKEHSHSIEVIQVGPPESDPGEVQIKRIGTLLHSKEHIKIVSWMIRAIKVNGEEIVQLILFDVNSNSLKIYKIEKGSSFVL